MATDPIDNQTNPTDVYIASRFKAEVGYGDTANLQPSSLLPGDTIKRSTIAKTLQPVAPVKLPADYNARQINAPGWETRPVSAKAFAPSHGMRNPNASPAKIPSTNNRRAYEQIANRVAKRG